MSAPRDPVDSAGDDRIEDDPDAWRAAAAPVEEYFEEIEVPIPPPRKAPLRIVPKEDRPDIEIGTDIQRMTDQAIALTGRYDLRTFCQGGHLVHVAATPRRKGDPPRQAEPQIRQLGRGTARERLSAYMRWTRERKTKGGDTVAVETTPPEAVVSAYLERGVWDSIRTLVGIATTPSLRPDGSVLQAPGYDPATGYLYLPREDYPTMPEEVSHDDARDALAQLVAPLADFPFASDASRYVIAAAIMTILARPAIDGPVPAFTSDASTRGSGKTKLADYITIVSIGRTCRTTYPAEAEELRKVMDGYALGGARAIVIDNIPQTMSFGGNVIDTFITAEGSVEVRALGETGQRLVPWLAVVIATGNNLSYLGDTNRRVLPCRLEPDTDKPEDRVFESDFIASAKNSRARLAVAALTVLVGYVQAGRPNVGTGVWGSFEAWSRLVPAAIAWAGGANVLDARPKSDAEFDPEIAAQATLLAGLATVAGSTVGIRVRTILDTLYPGGRPPRPDATPDGWGEIRDALEAVTRAKPGMAPSSVQVAGAFRRMKARWIGKKQIVVSKQKDKVGNVVTWDILSRE